MAMQESVKRFSNRELSWLHFNERVLDLAARESVPSLERLKFLAIFSQNLDEFFQVRVSGLLERVDAEVTSLSPDGLSAQTQLRMISERVVSLTRRADGIFLNELIPVLASEGIRFCRWAELDRGDQRELSNAFEQRLFPILTPLAVDPGHPFPYISNLALNLAAVITDPTDSESRFARVKVPQGLPRFTSLGDGTRFIPVEQVIAAHLHFLFEGMEISEAVAFRVTRDTDIDLEETRAEDLLEAVEMEVQRRRFGEAVRLELPVNASEDLVERLRVEHKLDAAHVYRSNAPIDLGGLWSVYGVDRPDLKFSALGRRTPRVFRATSAEPLDMFAVVRKGDVLVHHPYENFATTTQEFLSQAASDPAVQAIKLTLYRTSGDSPIMAALIRAADAGKQVVALVEVKARFDEQNNIEWARQLERSGVHVVYGLVGLKTHTKVAIVARDEGADIRVYCHVGTGNYNPKTATTYEDFGLLTADPGIGTDVQRLFNYLTGYGRDVQYQRLLVAPHNLRTGLAKLIRSERKAHRRYGNGSILMKMNSLVDPNLIDELYAASADGVRIQLIVRGICCLRPGLVGLSENIMVRSVVGRYLEHSRVYRFAHGAGQDRPAVYFGSADLMPRNLDRRVEALVSITDPSLAERIDTVLESLLADNQWSWELTGSHWKRVDPAAGEDPFDAHLHLHALSANWTMQEK